VRLPCGSTSSSSRAALARVEARCTELSARCPVDAFAGHRRYGCAPTADDDDEDRPPACVPMGGSRGGAATLAAGRSMKFHSKAIEEHAEVPLGDAGRLDQLISHWTERRAGPHTLGHGNACYVLSVYRDADSAGAHAQLAEITSLVAA